MSPDTLVFTFGAISTGTIALVFGFMWLLDGRRFFDLAWAGAMASYAAGIAFMTTRIATDAALAGDAATVMFWCFVVLMIAGNLDFVGRRVPLIWLPIAIVLTSALGMAIRMQDSQFGFAFVGVVTAALYFWTGWLLRTLPTIGSLAFGILALRAAGALVRSFFIGTPYLIHYSVTSFTLNFLVGAVLIAGSLLQSRQLLLASKEELRRSNAALKDHETELEETNRLLQEQAVRLERLGSDYLAALGRAEQANRAKDSFIANMNHEFRTPLNAVLGFTELIQAEAARGDNKRITEYSDYAHQAGRSMLRNVDRILTFIALDSGQRPSRNADFDPQRTLQRQVELLGEMARGKDVAVAADISRAPEAWRCDETMFRTIIDELLRNAIKAAPKGSTVTVQLAGDDCELMLQIVDSGPGLSDKFLKTVGDLFNISEHVLSRGGATQGVGLGLTIAARYARLMGGALMLDRNTPTGTVARVLLACAVEERAAVSAPPPALKAPTA